MRDYLETFVQSFTGYAHYLKNEIFLSYQDKPWYENYFYWLVGLSLMIWALEIFFPWRKNQKVIRKDFWIDSFYILFNFFLFSLIGYNAISDVAVKAFNDALNHIGITNIVAIEVDTWPVFLQFLLLFFIADFIQWNTHRLLHKIPWMWEFHKVHHSVKEMGFAAHFRFHWMETIIYKTIQFIPLTMIGFGIKDLFVLHMFTVLIGHLNHANVGWDYGIFRYIFNNPKMHIWHHAKALPGSRKNGVNFGISLSLWDYVFKTHYIPYEGKDEVLGFDDDEKFPESLGKQLIHPLKFKK